LDTYHVLELVRDKKKFARLTLVDAKDIDGASSRLVEITRRYEAEHDIVKPPKLCICLAEGSHPAEITEIHDVDEGFTSDPTVTRTHKFVVLAPDYTTHGEFGALVKFKTGEDVIVLLVFDFTAPISFGVHAWFVNRESRRHGRLSQLIGTWNRPKISLYFPHNASLFNIHDKIVTVDVIDRVILGERVIMASVSMKGYGFSGT
jgi:hypothetical protein